MDSRFSLVGATSSLRITNIQEADAGVYQCRAANPEDSLDASATIEVQVGKNLLLVEFFCVITSKKIIRAGSDSIRSY